MDPKQFFPLPKLSLEEFHQEDFFNQFDCVQSRSRKASSHKINQASRKVNQISKKKSKLFQKGSEAGSSQISLFYPLLAGGLSCASVLYKCRSSPGPALEDPAFPTSCFGKKTGSREELVPKIRKPKISFLLRRTSSKRCPNKLHTGNPEETAPPDSREESIFPTDPKYPAHSSKPNIVELPKAPKQAKAQAAPPNDPQQKSSVSPHLSTASLQQPSAAQRPSPPQSLVDSIPNKSPKQLEDFQEMGKKTNKTMGDLNKNSQKCFMDMQQECLKIVDAFGKKLNLDNEEVFCNVEIYLVEGKLEILKQDEVTTGGHTLYYYDGTLERIKGAVCALPMEHFWIFVHGDDTKVQIEIQEKSLLTTSPPSFDPKTVDNSKSLEDLNAFASQLVAIRDEIRGIEVEMAKKFKEIYELEARRIFHKNSSEGQGLKKTKDVTSKFCGNLHFWKGNKSWYWTYYDEQEPTR